MKMEHKYLTNAITIDVQETPEFDHFHEESDNDNDDDTLSLCDLPIHGCENEVVDEENPSEPDANFEFSTTKTLHNSGTDILFFGKSMFPYNNPQTTSSFTYNKLDQKTASHFHVSTTPPPRRCSSVRLSDIKSSPKQYNYNVFIGFGAKFDPPPMELREIRKRQGRRAPAPMLASFGGEQPVVGGGERGSRKGRWGGFLRPLRFRSNLVSALTRVSFGCAQRV